MRMRKVLSVLFVIVLLGGCAGLVIDPKSDMAISTFTESLGKVTTMSSGDVSKMDLAKDKESLNQIITNLKSVIEEKKQYDKAKPTITLIESTIELLNAWIVQIDKGSAKKVRNYLDLRSKDIIQQLQDLLDNENKK
jgi:flagellin-specific chaperone FliS